MNSGKICISICARTVGDLLEKVGRAEPLADVIEIRFDCLESSTIANALDRLRDLGSPRELLATNRPKDVDIAFNASAARVEINAAFEVRLSFWRSVLESRLFRYVDLEEDLVFALTHNEIFPPELLAGHTVIGSHHNFYDTPDLGPVLEGFIPNKDVGFRCDIVKVATTANSITDTIEQWYLLDWAKHYGVAAVPISMGEPGKWTRILGLAHGAAMTYAALDSGGETAPGQIAANDLIDVYRVKELGRETDVYGVIAGDTSYSMSPYIQNAAFKAARMDRVFLPLQVGDLGDFFRRMVHPESREIDLNFRGFAVTNPHKKAIIEYLEETDETARAIGAVNTVSIVDGKMRGTNTDAVGFITPLLGRFGDLRGVNAGVAGTGGAARACIYALKEAGADVTAMARNPAKAADLAAEFGCRTAEFPSGGRPLGLDILVNATPVGTKGGDQETPIATASELAGIKLVYDLVYNPELTPLIREAKTAGCETLGGLEMLIAQGAEQFRIWTEQPAELSAMRRAALERLIK